MIPKKTPYRALICSILAFTLTGILVLPVHSASAPILICYSSTSVSLGQPSPVIAGAYASSADGSVYLSINWGDGSNNWILTTSNSNGNTCTNGQVPADAWGFPTHVYAAAGSYSVTLIFVNNVGSSQSGFLTVTVNPTSGGSGGGGGGEHYHTL